MGGMLLRSFRSWVDGFETLAQVFASIFGEFDARLTSSIQPALQCELRALGCHRGYPCSQNSWIIAMKTAGCIWGMQWGMQVAFPRAFPQCFFAPVRYLQFTL